MNTSLLQEWGSRSSEMASAGLVLILVLVLIAAAIIPAIFFIFNLQKTLQEISAENRKMEPAQVWMVFIPGFGIVWMFFVVTRIAESLKKEFAARNIVVEEELPGRSIGLTYCILACCMAIPFVNLVASIPALICWIIYWVRINGYRKKLEGVKTA